MKPDWTRYAERIKEYTGVRNVVSQKTKPLADLEIDAGDSFVFEMLR